MKTIGYVGPCFDSSGYAEAARNNIVALHIAGVKVAVNPVTFEGSKTNHGKIGNIVKSLVNPDPDSEIQVVHTTPTECAKLRHPSKYNIAYTAWETSRLPDSWVEMVNLMDEIWVPSEWNVQVFKDSGVTKPVFCIPHTFDTSDKQANDFSDISIQGTEGRFVFYCISQWLERKNMEGLLKAYLTEFKENEKVCLVLKTFRVKPGDSDDVNWVKQQIRNVKEFLYLKKYPQVLLVNRLLSKEQIESMHNQANCYVSLQRAEGFGIPLVEAMMHEKPVISTGYGGVSEFLTEEIAYPVKYQLTPVYGMPWEQYRGNQTWAEPDLMHTRQLMRHVFENQSKATDKGKLAKRWVQENLSWEKIGTRMKERLEKI